MCGIIAITGKNTEKISDKTVEAMLFSLSKRGPDDKGFERFGGAILGQTRLSIVDLSPLGHQPMRDNTHPLTLVFNGEIYGYKETRKELERLGHRFSSQSDSEVILKAYAEYGKECLKHLDGMFAFAIWDDNKKELFVARDRFGKKPFYYALIGDTFFGASEIKALFATNLIKGRIDNEALDDYLRLSYLPPHKSIYSNIKTLPPAHAGIVKNGKIEIWKYWNLEKKESSISYDEAKKELKRLFDDAVKKRMVADVEIGSLLSGGVDSTLVTAYASKYTNKPIKTFAVGYGDYKNELPYALEASKKFGTDHYTLNANTNDLSELRNVIEYFDEPHGDSSDFPQHLISKLASSKVKVALSGDGADELMMGYGWYQKYWHTPRLKRLFGNPYSSYQKVVESFNKSERSKLLVNLNPKSDAVNEKMISKFKNPFEKINAHDLFVYLPGQLLTKVDRTSMMHSLEIRSPFLDTALAEFVYNLQIEYKLSKTGNKIILKDILSEIMPKEFVNRRKQGFGAPIFEWMKEESIKKEIARIVNNDNHPAYTYLNKVAVRSILTKSESDDKYKINRVWSLICLLLWFEIHAKYHE